MKTAFIMFAVLAVSGCDTGPDNSPDKFERRGAMKACMSVDNLTRTDDVPADVRIACTEAVYGG